MNFLQVQGHRPEYALIPGGDSHAPMLVFLYEGLGSLEMWKDFPSRCVDATGCGALIYSRYGYGNSDPLKQPRRVDFMHDEALNALPELLDKLGVEPPILFGLRDGGSRALIHAGVAGREVRGLILLAPHVMVEDFGLRSIEASKQPYETTCLRDKLARYHADPDSAFRGWNDIWLHPDLRLEYRGIPAAHHLPGSRHSRRGRPVRDHGADRADRPRHSTDRDVETEELRPLSPHRDQPEAVIQRVAQFVKGIRNDHVKQHHL